MRLMKIFSLFFVGLPLLVSGQPGWKWPEDERTAKEKNALYTDAMKVGNYAEALSHLKWLLSNAPDLNKSLYINGAKLYAR